MEEIKNNFKLYLLGFLLLINFFIWQVILTEQRNLLTVAFFDVGQGDSIFIESPDGKQVLIDGGKNSQVLKQLSKVMPFYDRSIDLVIMTHPDQDHIGGLVSVLENYKVDYFLEPGVSSKNGVYSEIEKIVDEKKIKKVLARQGMDIQLCNLRKEDKEHFCKAHLQILFPTGDVSRFETNTASIVSKLVYKKNSFLFTGDSPQSIEKYLVSVLGKQLNVDVLKLGHHGSRTSSSELFLGFTNPEYAVASVGKNNRYGHPHKEVLDLLKKLGISLLRTDEQGTIIFKSEGEGELQVTTTK